MKRIFPIFLCLCICVSVFAFSVSAEDTIVDGRTVLNYMDYIKGYDLSYASDGWAYLVLADEFFVSNKEDVNGYAEQRGTFPWYLQLRNDVTEDTYSANVTSAVPGGSVNNVFLDVTNIPTGSRLWIQAIGDVFAGVSSRQTEVLVSINSGITYYDENFNKINDVWSEQQFYRFDTEERFSQVVEITIEPPSNAKYCTFYTRCNFGTGRTNDVNDEYIYINFQYSAPNLKISTSYTQIIIESIIKAKPPEGYGTIIDLGELENILNGTTGEGMESADDIFQSAPAVVEQFLSGFLFMNYVISSLIASNWLNSAFTISLALGLFAFITNAGISMGRALEHKGKGGKT